MRSPTLSPPRPPSPADDAEPRRTVLEHARDVRPGFVVKLVLVAIANAIGLLGILSAWSVGSWGILAFLVVAFVAVDWAYFSRRAVPAKYLVPGLIFLFVYQVFAMGYTGYVAFTNYGDGHNSTKADAIEQILSQNELRVEGSAAYPAAVVTDGEELGLAVLDDGDVLVGTAEEPLTPATDAVVDGTRITAVPGWSLLDTAQIVAAQQEVTQLRVPVSQDAADGSIRTPDGMTGYVYQPVLTYDESTDTMVNSADGTVYAPNDRGNFVADDGTVLTPGWRVTVGLDNFSAFLTDARMSGPFLEIFVWTFAFAALSVLLTFGLGIFLAVTFNDGRVGGRRIYRSLMILPYAFPGFLSALIWRGMMNERFGWINEVLLGGATVGWLTDPTLAKISVLAVNLWLGFPYMFLICTGALQAIPSDMIDAARIDGAGRVQIFRRLTTPMIMVSVAPLLVASFAFNFNNFALIYMLTGGGPNFIGTPYVVGHTDILISMVYSVAFESGSKQYGVASALSILIFVLVGAISWFGFRRTRQLEEI